MSLSLETTLEDIGTSEEELFQSSFYESAVVRLNHMWNILFCYLSVYVSICPICPICPIIL